MCPVLTRGENVHVQNYTTNGQIIAAKDCHFFYYIPPAGHCLPYKLLFNGKQSDCLSSTLSFAIYQLYDLGQIYSLSCSSAFLICKMGIRLAPSKRQACEVKGDYPLKAFSRRIGLESAFVTCQQLLPFDCDR